PLRAAPAAPSSFLRPPVHSHTSVFSEVIEIPQALVRRQFENLLTSLLAVWSDSIFRMKGILRFQGSNDLFALHVVHQRFEITRMAKQTENLDTNRLVVIARDDTYRGFFIHGLTSCGAILPK
ncbi:MAG: GTP-binding protein, partial [Proteobacteria bacterium]